MHTNERLYYEWFNYWYTLANFADSVGLPLKTIQKMLIKGRAINNARFGYSNLTIG